MKKINTQIATLFLCMLGWSSIAQSGVNRANDSYDQYAYIDAINIYERIANKGKADADIYRKLGDSYYFNGQYEEAGKWYGKLFEEYSTDPIDAEYYYRYAETLKSMGETTQADDYFDRYGQMVAGRRAILIRERGDYMSEIRANSGRYDISPIEVNSSSSDYGSTIYNNKLLFTTARDTGNFSKRIHTWTGDYYTTIFSADINEDGTLSNAEKFSKGISSKYNESTPVITKDGNTMYFTRNNYDGKRGYNHNRSTLLKIYKATKDENGKWGNVEELPINSDEFSNAHPMLNADETELYFVSDRPNGEGGSDLWKVAITADGDFGTPVNLGANINTDGRETFPYLSADNVLYFSSDGRPGLGGLDVFAVKIKADGTYTEIQNVGEPINSAWDDFAYIIDPQTQRGYFSSNRPEGAGNDDIYRFVETRALQLECLQNLEVRVIDKETGEVIEGAQISLLDGHRNVANKATQEGTQYITILTGEECGIFYRVQASAEEYQSNEAGALLEDKIGGITRLDIALEREKVKVEKGDDLFKTLDLNPIYFDLDKSNIRSDAAQELTKILAVMEEYPSMKIDIRSHTDSRASMAYNDRLSERRAQSTRQWLIDQGIAPDRLTAKGYGERQLINRCADGVDCSEEEHQANRRSEFIVVEL